MRYVPLALIVLTPSYEPLTRALPRRRVGVRGGLLVARLDGEPVVAADAPRVLDAEAAVWTTYYLREYVDGTAVRTAGPPSTDGHTAYPAAAWSTETIRTTPETTTTGSAMASPATICRQKAAATRHPKAMSANVGPSMVIGCPLCVVEPQDPAQDGRIQVRTVSSAWRPRHHADSHRHLRRHRWPPPRRPPAAARRHTDVTPALLCGQRSRSVVKTSDERRHMGVPRACRAPSAPPQSERPRPELPRARSRDDVRAATVLRLAGSAVHCANRGRTPRFESRGIHPCSGARHHHGPDFLSGNDQRPGDLGGAPGRGRSGGSPAHPSRPTAGPPDGGTSATRHGRRRQNSTSRQGPLAPDRLLPRVRGATRVVTTWRGTQREPGTGLTNPVAACPVGTRAGVRPPAGVAPAGGAH
jgi:hypothetical protein